MEVLIGLLDLGDFDGARTNEDIFLGGPSQKQPRHRVFGGQVLAQSMMAGMRTVDPDRVAHSMHGYFLRPGDANKPITFGVERLRDGRSFSARRVHAYQDGVPILSMIASFQVEDSGLDHQAQMPEASLIRKPCPAPPSCCPTTITPWHGTCLQSGPSTSATSTPALYVSPTHRSCSYQCCLDEDHGPPFPMTPTFTGPPWCTRATTRCWNPSSVSTAWPG